jgi:hypothetical protein
VTVLPTHGLGARADCSVATSGSLQAGNQSCKKRSKKKLRAKLKRARKHHKHKRAKKIRHRLRARRCRR